MLSINGIEESGTIEQQKEQPTSPRICYLLPLKKKELSVKFTIHRSIWEESDSPREQLKREN